MPLDRYWNLALFDAEHGYYTTRDPIGRGGDFTTAPEISQMFGELLGAWAASAWVALGAPAPFVFAEIGPGRGTLMADMLRTIRRIRPDFLKAAHVTLVERSDRLARVQAERLGGFDLPVRHRRAVEEIEPLPLVLVANELFDAIATRQFVRTADGWAERSVALGDDDRLHFVAIDLPPEAQARLPQVSADTVLEIAPEREALAARIGERLKAHGGTALLVDYGHGGGFGDTVQAVRAHAFADPLDEPGTADITSHVDFRALARRFAASGTAVAPLMDQGEFLIRLGLLERAGRLGSGKGEPEREAIRAAAQRLAGTGPGEMGSLFKVLCVAHPALPLPPFPSALLD